MRAILSTVLINLEDQKPHLNKLFKLCSRNLAVVACFRKDFTFRYLLSPESTSITSTSIYFLKLAIPLTGGPRFCEVGHAPDLPEPRRCVKGSNSPR